MNKKISFPEHEYESIQKYLADKGYCYTTRVYKEVGKYKAGETYTAPWGDVLKIEEVKTYRKVSDRPFYDEMSDDEKEEIRMYSEDMGLPYEFIKFSKSTEGDKKDILIRKMIPEDILYFPSEFLKQGWNKEKDQYAMYFEEQEKGIRQVFVATVDGAAAGYATLLPQDITGPFKDRQIPVIVDFNVLIKYQKMGVGTAIMDYIESSVKKYSTEICLGVGLHYGYGAAQRMYVKRGYIPDGSGVWFNGERLEQYSPCCNDDELILYLSKRF